MYFNCSLALVCFVRIANINCQHRNLQTDNLSPLAGLDNLSVCLHRHTEACRSWEATWAQIVRAAADKATPALFIPHCKARNRAR